MAREVAFLDSYIFRLLVGSDTVPTDLCVCDELRLAGTVARPTIRIRSRHSREGGNP